MLFWIFEDMLRFLIKKLLNCATLFVIFWIMSDNWRRLQIFIFLTHHKTAIFLFEGLNLMTDQQLWFKSKCQFILIDCIHQLSFIGTRFFLNTSPLFFIFTQIIESIKLFFANILLLSHFQIKFISIWPVSLSIPQIIKLNLLERFR